MRLFLTLLYSVTVRNSEHYLLPASCEAENFELMVSSGNIYSTKGSPRKFSALLDRFFLKNGISLVYW